MTTIPVIVQARMGSTRLPGKVLMPLLGKTFLEHCLDRCARIEGISEVIVATTDDDSCDPIAALADRRGWRVFRGSQQDVLARYLGAAREVRADAVMRITSDCPLTDPGTSSAALADFRQNGGDLVTTNIPPSWPIGMDTEIVTMDALEQAGREGVLKSDREHVTSFVRRRPMRYALRNLPCPEQGHAHLRITLDTPADRDFFVALSDSFPGDLAMAPWQDIFAHLHANPAIWALNTDEAFG